MKKNVLNIISITLAGIDDDGSAVRTQGEWRELAAKKMSISQAQRLVSKEVGREAVVVSVESFIV